MLDQSPCEQNPEAQSTLDTSAKMCGQIPSLLSSSVDTPIHDSRFRVLWPEPTTPVLENDELTPAEEDVGLDAAALGEDGDKDEHVEVEALNEDPHVVTDQGVHEERDQRLAFPVLKINRKQNSDQCMGTRTNRSRHPDEPIHLDQGPREW